MAYQALYRRYRPHTFDDVKGQEHIVRTLENQLHTDRIGHAYLFTGTRGTGKTTVARIFAAAVNCEHPAEDGSPCGECASCSAIASGNSMNVIEIDAASNSRVEEMRELIGEVEYPPTEGRYKVYIIDEVHMLSTAAFNALLKTLEEPPSYVIFILATTEVHKVPITILSRCQRYDFKRMTMETIVDRMGELEKLDGHEVEEKGLYYIARRADGSMRDALSLLDQCISFYPDGTLSYDQILSVLGAVDTEVFSEMLRRLLAKDVAGVMRQVEEVVMAGRELTQFVVDFTWYLRNLLLLKSADDMEDVLDVSTEHLQRLKEEAKLVDVNVLMRYIHIMSELLNDLKRSSQKRALLEVAMIRIMQPQMDEDYTSVIDRLVTLEQQVRNGVVVQAGASDSTEKEPVAPAGVQKQEFPEAVEEDVKKAAGMWQRITADASGIQKSMLSGAYVSVSEDGKSLLLVYDEADKTQATMYKQLSQPQEKESLERLVAEHVGAQVNIVLHLNNSELDRTHKYTDAVARFEKETGMKIEEEDF